MPLLASGEVSGFQVPGAITSRCWADFLRGTYERCRGESTVLTYAVSSQTSSPRLGGNCWSRDLKVRRLLRIAQVECRPSLAPPISLDSLSSAGTHKAISLNAHCLSSPNHPMLVSICLARETVARILSTDGDQDLEQAITVEWRPASVSTRCLEASI